MGKYPEATQLAQDYVNVYSNDWQGWRILGRANYEQENINSAVNAYTNAVRLGDVSSCDVLAVIALKANRLDAFPLIVPELLLQKDSSQTDHGTCARDLPMKTQRWDSFSVTSGSQAKQSSPTHLKIRDILTEFRQRTFSGLSGTACGPYNLA
jgi:hypothetical protein